MKAAEGTMTPDQIAAWEKAMRGEADWYLREPDPLPGGRCCPHSVSSHNYGMGVCKACTCRRLRL